ncbi:MAG: CoA transferase, partial [Acidimicrobiales bacterium]
MSDRSEQRRSWAASGAMALTGRADGPPLVAPDGVVERMVSLGRDLGIKVLPLLGERAAIASLTRRGDVSCGGATRLLRTLDGWVAVTLARDEDVAAVPAWLQLPEEVDDDPWSVVAQTLAGRDTASAVDRAILLGLPVSALPSRPGPESPRAEPPFAAVPVQVTEIGDDRGLLRREPVVVDLSSLWSGPLCGRLLGGRG